MTTHRQVIGHCSRWKTSVLEQQVRAIFQPPRWTLVGKSELGRFYADGASIQRSSENVVRMTNLTDYENAITRGGNSWQSDRSEREYDCRDRKARARSLITYGGAMGTGAVILSMAVDAPWEDIAPNSLGANLLNVACKNVDGATAGPTPREPLQKSPSLGFTVHNLSPGLAESIGLPNTAGAAVASVEKGSPAARAGIEKGDVILRIGKEEIENVADLVRTIKTLGAETDLAIKVHRRWTRRAEELTLDIAERSY